MFEIHFRRDIDTKEDFVLVAKGLSSLEKALDERVVAGDLVVDETTHDVVTNPSWLFDWERTDPNCYAQRAIRHQAGLKMKSA